MREIDTADIRAWADAWEADGTSKPDAIFLRQIADEIDRLRDHLASAGEQMMGEDI